MLRISEISFPGFGIDFFKVDSVAFSIGSIDIAWYAIIITFGMVLAVLYTIYRAKPYNITTDDIIDFALFTIPIGVIGARLYYVLSKLENFHSIKDVFNIRGGGLAIYGGIIAGGITVIVVALKKKIPPLALGDYCTPGVILAQAVGRWGNFANGEAFGYETDIFCRMGLKNSLTNYEIMYVHPTFLYESLWNIAGFIIANLMFKHRKYDGEIFLFVFSWYGLGRFFVEGMRTDSLYMNIFGLELRTSQVLAAILFIVCTSVLIYLRVKKFEKPLFVAAKKNDK